MRGEQPYSQAQKGEELAQRLQKHPELKNFFSVHTPLSFSLSQQPRHIHPSTSVILARVMYTSASQQPMRHVCTTFTCMAVSQLTMPAPEGPCPA